jgi:small multidrug resistance pump
MSWFYLAVAIAFEVAGTVCMNYGMKMSEGRTQFWLSALMLLLYALGLGAMALAVRNMDVSIAYPLWTGVGLALVAIVGMALFKEHVSPLKLISLAFVVVGVVGLSYTEHKRSKCRTQETGSLQLKTEESQPLSE